MAKKTPTPPLAGWIGGKSRLAKRIIERIPEHTCYVEPFAGAAWILFRKPPSKVEVLNDLQGDIVRVYRVIKHHPDELARQFDNTLISRAEFERLRATPPETLTDIQRAARFLYLVKFSFGGTAHKQVFGYSPTTKPRATSLSIMAKIQEASERLSAVTVENLPFSDCIARYDRANTFFYLDPPYYGCEKDYGPGLFERGDFAALAGQLAGIKGKFLLSLNDRPEIRNLFSSFRFQEVTASYCIGPRMKAPELLISNY